MHNSSSHIWHQAFASADCSVHKQVLSSSTFGCAGLFALALSVSHFVFQPSDVSDQAVAHAAIQPEAVAGLTDEPGSPPSRQAACTAVPSASAESNLANHPDTRKQLVAHVESTYRVPASLAQKIVNTTITVSRENDMDPFLALGIIANESSFNYKAESSYGAAGLMQIHAPSHQALLQEIGVRERNPRTVQRLLTAGVKLNVTAGIRIYKAYEKQYGSPVKALQAYNGARNDASHRYARKVLSMRDGFRRVAMPYESCV
jgi:soluble lytic murein transglycosylase-like protein